MGKAKWRREFRAAGISCRREVGDRNFHGREMPRRDRRVSVSMRSISTVGDPVCARGGARLALGSLLVPEYVVEVLVLAALY
jgi:hypothetical protein